MAIFNWQKKPAEDGTEAFTLPDELTAKINAGAGAAEELPKITQLLKDLQSTVLASTEAQKKKDDAAAEALRRQQQQQQQQQGDVEFEELMLTDPKAAVSRATTPLAQELALLRFDNTKRELFEDADKFEYYHGDLKKEIDELIARQPLSFKANPQFAADNIKNCYDTVIGKHHKEILEGKLKTRFAASEGARGTSTGSAGSSGAGPEQRKGVVTDDVRKAAKLLGFSPEEYAKMLDEEGVAYV